MKVVTNKSSKKFTSKEKRFLKDLEKAVDWVNNYKHKITPAKTLQQFLAEL